MKNFRPAVNAILDLCDPTDPLDLAQACENAAKAMRQVQATRDREREAAAHARAIAPWFEPNP